MMYRDRAEAGRRLVQRLREQVPGLDGDDLVVLGMVPGGVPVARAVSLAFRAPLDVAVAVRLPAPGYDALGLGGIGSGGVARVDARTVAMLGISDEYLEETIVARSAEVTRVEKRCRGSRAPVPLRGKRVIITDDGGQTRFRSRAAVAAARNEGAREVIFAVPVAASDVLTSLLEEADAVVCDHVPERFCGIGAYYGEWEPPGIEDVRAMLTRLPPGGILPSPSSSRRTSRRTEPL
jgi:predicted phosphoribosyltransferase